MKTIWYEGARDKEARKERDIILTSALNAFKILTGILEGKITAKESERNRNENYDLPSYGYMQADASGYIRALREVQSLLEHKENNG